MEEIKIQGARIHNLKNLRLFLRISDYDTLCHT